MHRILETSSLLPGNPAHPSGNCCIYFKQWIHRVLETVSLFPRNLIHPSGNFLFCFKQWMHRVPETVSLLPGNLIHPSGNCCFCFNPVDMKTWILFFHKWQKNTIQYMCSFSLKSKLYTVVCIDVLNFCENMFCPTLQYFESSKLLYSSWGSRLSQIKNRHFPVAAFRNSKTCTYCSYTLFVFVSHAFLRS